VEGGAGCIADGRNMRMLPTEYTACNDLNAVRKLEVLLGDCSRVLLLPPPLLAFTPYFSKYVQFAWRGRGYRSIVGLLVLGSLVLSSDNHCN
jgi:hypothetical protein